MCLPAQPSSFNLDAWQQLDETSCDVFLGRLVKSRRCTVVFLALERIKKEDTIDETKLSSTDLTIAL